jgi:hypothetical protein
MVVTAVGVAAILQSGTDLFKSSNVANEVMFVTSAIGTIRHPLYAQPDASYATTANIIAGGLVPANRISGGNITSPWGNITIAPANILGTANDGFTWTYPSTVPLRACKALVDGIAPYATMVRINATVVKAYGALLAETAVDTQCAALTGGIVFGFSRVAT